MAQQATLRAQRSEHASGWNPRDDLIDWRLDCLLGRQRLVHRADVDRLQARLLLLQLVERSPVLGQPCLQLRGERRAIADGGVPRQRVGETLAVQLVAERVLAKPAFQGFLVGRLRRKLCHEQPAVACFAAQLFESAVGDDQTLPHDGDAVRHELGLAQHVGRDDQSRAASPLLTEEVAHVSRGNRVETRCRLVAENPVGFVQRGPDQRDLLRHAAREGGKHGVRAIGQLEALQEVADSLASNRFGYAVEVSEVVEVLRRRVAAVKARLVGHDPEPRADLVKLVRQSKPVELDQARVRM